MTVKKTSKKTAGLSLEKDLSVGNHSFIFAEKGKRKKPTVIKAPHTEVNLDFQKATHAVDPTQIYLRELGYKSLLTAEEEVTLARLVQKEMMMRHEHG